MKLRKPCEHDLYDHHIIPSGLYLSKDPSYCPGGEFLADDALADAIAMVLYDYDVGDVNGAVGVILDALTVREGDKT